MSYLELLTCGTGQRRWEQQRCRGATMQLEGTTTNVATCGLRLVDDGAAEDSQCCRKDKQHCCLWFCYDAASKGDDAGRDNHSVVSDDRRWCKWRSVVLSATAGGAFERKWCCQPRPKVLRAAGKWWRCQPHYKMLQAADVGATDRGQWCCEQLATTWWAKEIPRPRDGRWLVVWYAAASARRWIQWWFGPVYQSNDFVCLERMAPQVSGPVIRSPGRRLKPISSWFV
jgi:hypothetical protein